MSKIDELIKNYCPNGVEHRKIGDIAQYEQPGKYLVSNTNYNNSYKTPVLTAGQTFILGYTNETNGIFPASKENPVIIFDDFTAAFKWVDFPFMAKSSAMKMITAKDGIILRYLYHLMGHIGYTSNEHKRLWIGTYSKITVPVPPIPIQKKIVKILDKFTELETALKAELEARKKQYVYYCNQILSHEYLSQWGDVEYITIGEIGKVSMCRRIMKKDTSADGGVPFYKIGTFGKQADAYISWKTFERYKTHYPYPKKGDVLISAAGTIGRTIIFDGKPAYFQDSNIVWVANDESLILNDFLYYWYQTSPWKVSASGTVDRLYNENISGAKVPLLPKNTQKYLIKTLGKFKTLCNDLTTGLPAELTARRQQYKYYRDKLLTFQKF